MPAIDLRGTRVVEPAIAEKERGEFGDCIPLAAISQSASMLAQLLLSMLTGGCRTSCLSTPVCFHLIRNKPIIFI